MIQVKAMTWDKDTMGLFDYECSTISKQHHKIDQCQVKILRNAQTIEIGNEEKEYEAISYIYKNNDEYHVDFQRLNEKLTSTAPGYLVVRSLMNKEGQSRGYRLKLGDEIKLGRSEFKIREIYASSLFRDHDQIQSSMKGEVVIDPTIECRICLENAQTADNPLLQLCNCRGSQGAIHLECIRKCLQTRIKQKKQQSSIQYKWKKPMKCELCQADITFKLNLQGNEPDSTGKLIPIICFPKPEGPYIKLEGTTPENQGYYYISLIPGKRIEIGRGQDCDVMLNDITISRKHAWIEVDPQGQIRLHDNNSKFGTLVKIQGPVKITKYPLVCQVGRSVLSFTQVN